MKLVLLSNRLPVSVQEEQGEFHFSPSPGGLASGVRTFVRSPRQHVPGGYIWLGWPGREIAPDRQEEVRQRLHQEFSARPVFLSTADTEAFYEGFCNKTLWPLFHYFPERVAYDENQWQIYNQVNERFADAVLEVAEPGDLVWVHDYHFLLVPALLRRRQPALRLGFFLHIPFPSYELFRLLPDRWRTALLEGMLGADVIGFHTHDYRQHFLKSVRRILGHEHALGEIILKERLVQVDTFPMGIDFQLFAEKARDPGVHELRQELRRPLGGCRAILSIDRLDYTKGIANRLRGYEAFLEAQPPWHGRVVLIMVVVPSRTGVEDYQQMKARIDELVGRINGRFGSLTWTPVLYQYKNFDQDHLIALYGLSDVMLVTPLRDGMNLVAKEYLAARLDDTGVLVLSEMAGAASELGEAVTVNPNDIRGIAQALERSLAMPAEEQINRMSVLRERTRRYDVFHWASDFLKVLREQRSMLGRNILSSAARQRLLNDWRRSEHRLLLCDYDGTLVPIRPTPAEARPSPEILDTLARLASLADVVIVSGRPRSVLETWLGPLDVSLVAEHGVWVRRRRHEWIRAVALNTEWKQTVRDLMELYVHRLPGSMIEEKEYTLAWHYRQAEPELAAQRAQELTDHLIELTSTSDLRILEGRKVIEVRPASVSKGIASQLFLGEQHEFILALGDDTTDEDLFRVLPRTAYSVRVGITRSQARYNLYSQVQARRLLEELAEAGSPAVAATIVTGR
ncbi:MAG TPA: bifunctional alpha,alpha-trehalose-phosphate synthase (UDP-forming)/trehalose-phosphatase, partial [Gemmataceae bacterium]|nr:bifunctional alpha,alpha-trehalose-phosphate synthase (UDP-forming)/trehalose-phosphatase [Gemmataceae bacterium]